METFGHVLSSIHQHFRDETEIDFVDGLNFLQKHCTKIHELEEENRFEDDEDDSDDDSVQILTGFMKEFDLKGMLEKFVSKNERVIKENLHGFRGKTAASDKLEKFRGKSNAGEEKDDTTSDRDLNDDMFTDSGEELKLERFRVKTVNLGVVKEEGQQ